jgi:hypothetical protein
MTKPMPRVPEKNRSPKGPGSEPEPVRDDTKGHKRDETNNIDEQGDRANMKQNTSNRRS